MNVVLVDNLILPEQGSLAQLDVHPHLGLLALAAAAEAHGHAVRIYDPKRLIRAGALRYDATVYDQVAAELLATAPDVVGFTTLGCSLVFALEVAAALERREPDLPILLGGPHATMLDRAILERFPAIDVVVRHEADEVFPAVLDHLDRRRFDWIPGITWRAGAAGIRATDGKPKVDDLDTLPLTSYDHYPVEELGLDLLRIEAGRGCPFACTFCSTAGFFQRSFRLKSAARLVRELDRLHARYGVRDFKLDHDMFTVNRKKVIEFCDAVADRGYRWRVSARVDCVDAELLARMAAAGCVNLYFGIEAGSPRMQALCKKRLDVELVLPTLEAATRLGIETTASFITGYPQERADDQDATLDLLGRCVSPRCLTQLHILAPEPGTPMFDAFGAAIAYDGYGGPYNAALVGPDDEATVLAHPDLFQTYYYYPGELPRARHVFAVEAVDRLRRLGPVVLAYLLRAYGGSLARLVRALREHTAARAAPPPTTDDVLALIAAAFGPAHHLTSLVRFALSPASAADAPSPTAPTSSPPDRFDPRAHYLHVAGDVLLTEIHDCGDVLARIAALPPGDALLDDARAGELGSYARVAGSVVWIDPGAHAVVELFDEPQPCAAIAELVAEATGGAVLDDEFFAGLVRAGLLVTVAPP